MNVSMVPGQVGEGDAPVDHQALDLVEHGEVAGVGGVAPVAAPGHDGVDRQRAVEHGLLHQVDLHRRGVGAQQRRLGLAQVEVEGVPHAPGRMGRRDVEGAEVVPVGLDLGTLGHLEPHADEHVLERVTGLGHQVEVAPGGGPGDGAGHVLGQVEPRRGQLGRAARRTGSRPGAPRAAPRPRSGPRAAGGRAPCAPRGPSTRAPGTPRPAATSCPSRWPPRGGSPRWSPAAAMAARASATRASMSAGPSPVPPSSPAGVLCRLRPWPTS